MESVTGDEKSETTSSTAEHALGRTSPKSITSIDELSGEYVMSSKAIEADEHDKGILTTIAAIAGSDSILITNFGIANASVKAAVNLTSMTVTVPSQTVGASSKYGRITLAAYNTTSGIADTSTQLSGIISSDSTIYIVSPWCLVALDDGDYYGTTLATAADAMFYAVNGIMTYTAYNTSTTQTTTTTVKVAVVQASESEVSVKNFFGTGAAVNINLYGSRRASIESQYVTTYALTTGDTIDAYTYDATFSDSYSLTSYSSTIHCNQALDSRTISWGNWTLVGDSYYFLTALEGKIETYFDLVYPSPADFPLTGDGTSDSPYTISTAAEWNALATYINEMYDDMSGCVMCLKANLDFTSTKITAIGAGSTVEFNGELNGNSCTITNLTDTLDADYSGALFVTAGSSAYIHDFTVKGKIISEYSYTGGVVGRLYGTISNVVCNATVYNSGTYCSSCIVGYAGIGSIIADCSFTGTTRAYGGYESCIVGYAYSATITRCCNKGTIKSTGKYFGSIASYCYKSTITDCINSGSINATNAFCGGLIGDASYCTIDALANQGSLSFSGTYAAGIASQMDYCAVSGCTNDGTITATTSYAGGLFSLVNYSTISDCANHSTVSLYGVYSGGVVGEVCGGSMSGCVNSGTINASAKRIGGIVGVAKNAEISGCVNTGTITSSSEYVGGVAAASSGCTLSGCGNEGEVTYTGSTTNPYIAGVVGEAYYGTYSECYNSGTVNATTKSVSYIGGVIGALAYTQVYPTSDTPTSSDHYIINGCYNTSDITCYAYAAGIVGYIEAVHAYIDMYGCWNSGTINNTYTGSYSTGGISGFYTKNSTFVNCWNEGDIISAGSSAAGGLFGVAFDEATAEYPVIFTGCHNLGDVITNGNYSGGIVGNISTDYTTVDSCWNAGTITAVKGYSGGIAGDCLSNAETSHCFNTGQINAGTYAGGIYGRSNSTVNDCYNVGNIIASNYAGGIVGLTVSGETTIARCYSMGEVTASGSSIGNIVGVNTNDTERWSTGNSLTETYFLDVTDAGGNDGYSQSLSRSQLAALELDGWDNGDVYTYPITVTNDYSLAYAAAIIPADGDNYDTITANFHIGRPDGVEWTTSNSVLAIDGNNATFSDTFEGTITLTVTIGEMSLSTDLTCDVNVASINQSITDSRTAIERRLYLPSGVPVASASDDHSIYIVVTTYDDGTTLATKHAK